jgi:hypothetical protein
MGRVTGLGGVFFKAENPEKLYEWYEKHLGIKQDVLGQGVSFRWKEDGDPDGFTAWRFAWVMDPEGNRIELYRRDARERIGSWGKH